MGLPSGLGAQLGFKAETTYNTPVTVDRFGEFMDESIVPLTKQVEVFGLRAGRSFASTTRFKTVTVGYRGGLTIPVYTAGQGVLFQHAFGDDTITTITGTARRHTITRDTAAQLGKMLTMQLGRPAIDGTVHPFTYAGGKLYETELECGVDGYLTAKFAADFASGTTGTALASASYPASQAVWSWAECAITVAGGAFFAKKFNFKYAPGLHIDRIGLGNSKRQPIANAEAMGTGSFDIEFEALTDYAKYLAGTTVAVVITFTTADFITGSTPYVFKITLPACRFEKYDPNVNGPDIIAPTVDFKVLDDGSNAPITLVIDNADTAA